MFGEAFEGVWIGIASGALLYGGARFAGLRGCASGLDLIVVKYW